MKIVNLTEAPRWFLYLLVTFLASQTALGLYGIYVLVRMKIVLG
jgi:hypothetical protein